MRIYSKQTKQQTTASRNNTPRRLSRQQTHSDQRIGIRTRRISQTRMISQGYLCETTPSLA